MASPESIRTRAARQERARAQSAELAAALTRENDMQGGTGPHPPTRHELQMLRCLEPKVNGATPDELLEAHPDRFAGRSWSGLHLTGASLFRKGWVTRGRRQINRHGDGRMSGGPRSYKINEAGRQVLREREAR